MASRILFIFFPENIKDAIALAWERTEILMAANDVKHQSNNVSISNHSLHEIKSLSKAG